MPRPWSRPRSSIGRRSAGLTDTARGTVRISAGEAMTAFIASHLPRLRRNLQCVEFELVASHMLANLSRREADLLIREQVPDLASIVTRRLGRVAYAVYGSPAIAVGDAARDTLRQMPWISFDEEHNYMPGQSWLFELLMAPGPPCVSTTGWSCTTRHEPARASPCFPAMSATAIACCGASAPFWRTSPPTNGFSSIAICGTLPACAP